MKSLFGTSARKIFYETMESFVTKGFGFDDSFLKMDSAVAIIEPSGGIEGIIRDPAVQQMGL